ncbi:MAG: HAD family hydrolase [Tissierellia bacterium]|nr:HAD family hydrolase [Tissierellia bacterium]
MIRLIALDFDGTIAEYEQAFDAHMAHHLERWQQMGIHVVVASGRPFRSLKRILDALPGELPIVSSNGNILRYKNSLKTLHASYMSPELIETNIRLLRKRGIHPVFHVDGYEKGYDLAVLEPPSPRERTYIEKYENRCITVTPETIAMEKVLVIAAYMTPAQFDAYVAQPEIQRSSGQYHSLKSLNREFNLIEVVEASSNKFRAVQHYAQLMGIGPDEILAAGDDMNDLSMVEGAAIGIAMPTAPEVVRRAADYVAEKPARDYGLFPLINKILEEEGYGH